MVRGMYAAAAGVFSQQKEINTISNNMSNVLTAGYKKSATQQSSFAEHMLSRVSAAPGVSRNAVGPGAFMTVNQTEYTNFEQGRFETTHRNVDMAIQGKGFFLVESGTHGPVATRNGRFEIDDEGFLFLPGLGRVLGDGGQPLQIRRGDFTVDPEGNILLDGKKTAALSIVSVPEEGPFTKVGEGVFKTEGGFAKEAAGNYRILQHTVERSNVNVAEEMSRIIAGQNQYQSCTQMLKMYDKLNEISVNQIGRIG